MKKIELSSRKENVRDKNEVGKIVVQFDLEEIKSHFYEGLDDVKKQFDVANALLSNDKIEEAECVWRSQIVFVEALLDFFMHEISKYALIKMFKGEWEKTASYSDFPVPMKTVEEGLKNPESTEWLFAQLNERFSREVYLSGDSLGSQLSLIGMKYDDVCKAAFPPQNGVHYVSGQQRLRKFYARRNQIAHQTDRKHSTAQKEPIDRGFVEEAIATVVSFVESVLTFAVSKGE